MRNGEKGKKQLREGVEKGGRIKTKTENTEE